MILHFNHIIPFSFICLFVFLFCFYFLHSVSLNSLTVILPGLMPWGVQWLLTQSKSVERFFTGKFFLWGLMSHFPYVRHPSSLSQTVDLSCQGISAELVNNTAEFCKDAIAKPLLYLTSLQAHFLLWSQQVLSDLCTKEKERMNRKQFMAFLKDTFLTQKYKPCGLYGFEM